MACPQDFTVYIFFEVGGMDFGLMGGEKSRPGRLSLAGLLTAVGGQVRRRSKSEFHGGGNGDNWRRSRRDSIGRSSSRLRSNFRKTADRLRIVRRRSENSVDPPAAQHCAVGSGHVCVSRSDISGGGLF